LPVLEICFFLLRHRSSGTRPLTSSFKGSYGTNFVPLPLRLFIFPDPPSLPYEVTLDLQVLIDGRALVCRRNPCLPCFFGRISPPTLLGLYAYLARLDRAFELPSYLRLFALCASKSSWLCAGRLKFVFPFGFSSS